MYNAVRTGVVKINRLPPSFFDALFRVKSVSELQHLIVKNSALFNRLLADESIPKTTRSFLGDFVSAAHSGRLNETAALKANRTANSAARGSRRRRRHGIEVLLQRKARCCTKAIEEEVINGCKVGCEGNCFRFQPNALRPRF